MAYLHKSEFQSHGYLSSANCHVDSRWVLKVSGFALHAFREENTEQVNKRSSAIFLLEKNSLNEDDLAKSYFGTFLNYFFYTKFVYDFRVGLAGSLLKLQIHTFEYRIISPACKNFEIKF